MLDFFDNRKELLSLGIKDAASGGQPHQPACDLGQVSSLPWALVSWSVKWDHILTSRGFPDSSAGKESACNAGVLGSIPGLGRSPGEGNRYPLQYSGLENSMDCIVHGVAKSRIQLSDFHKLASLLSLHALQAQSQQHRRHHGHLQASNFQISISRPHLPSEHQKSIKLHTWHPLVVWICRKVNLLSQSHSLPLPKPSSLLIYFLLKDNCFTEFCCFLSCLNMNQP